MARRPLIAGNWKMNGTIASLTEIKTVAEAAAAGLSADRDILVCPPAVIVSASCGVARDRIAIGGQDCHAAESGAHTGDIAAKMLKDVGARYVIVGHSERRADHGEDNATVEAKARAAIAAGLIAIVCIGEREDERSEGRTLDVLGAQLAGSLPDGIDGDRLVVAYEPIWAIGTGRTPTADDIGDVHNFIRERLIERFGQEVGEDIRLLYGGSVKPTNAAEILGIGDVDGALVGGASLKADDFIAICRAATPS